MIARTCCEGPFGEVIRATGPMAKANPFRFSTKYQDDETDLLYYGYRYYNTTAGRWISRDPIAERGGPSPYAFVHNDPNARIDISGLFSWPAIRLRCGKCGPDVTSAVAKTLDDVERVFNDDNNPSFRSADEGTFQNPDYYRRRACMVLYAPIAGVGNPGDAWDIGPLAALGGGATLRQQDLPEGLTWDDFGTKSCKRTVTYKGTCVYAGALNYILFGKINKLCRDRFSNQPFTITRPINRTIDWSWSDVSAAVWYQKYGRWGHYFNSEAANAFEFARIGYSGGDLPRSVDMGCRANTSKAWPNTAMFWRWSGVRISK
jgi:RHS repeat-associated protein